MSDTSVSPLNESVAIHQQLRAAIQEGTAIRISREKIDGERLTGFVAAIGSRFFALEIISDRIYLDGFVFLRIEDVSLTEFPAPHWSFHKTALSLRNQQRSIDLSVDCSSISALLLSIPKNAGVIAIHSEEADPEVCFIGKVADLDEESLTLDTISPDAKWDDDQMVFKLSDITRVDFGGGYEDALHQVQFSNSQ